MLESYRRGTTERLLAVLRPAEIKFLHDDWSVWARDDQIEPPGDWVDLIERSRIASAPPLGRIVVGVDPPASSTERSDACGIIVAGRAHDASVCILADATIERAKPHQWAARAVEYSAAGRTIRFEQDRPGLAPILHMALFHPADDHYGLSPIEVAATAIDIHNAASAWNKALLDNSARPSGALVYAGSDGAANLSQDQFERVKRELEDAYLAAEVNQTFAAARIKLTLLQPASGWHQALALVAGGYALLPPLAVDIGDIVRTATITDPARAAIVH